MQRKAAASPGPDDFAAEAGATITREANGDWKGVVRGEENIRRALQMQRAARRVEVEKGRRIAASRQRERIVTRDGRALEVQSNVVDQVKDKTGIRARTGVMLTGGWLPNAKDRAAMAQGGGVTWRR